MFGTPRWVEWGVRRRWVEWLIVVVVGVVVATVDEYDDVQDDVDVVLMWMVLLYLPRL